MKKLDYPALILRDGDKRYRSLEVKANGDFVYEQVDYEQVTSQVAPNGGDNDYEYWVTVESENVSSILLELVRDRFNDQCEFEKWLKSKSIQYTFESY